MIRYVVRCFVLLPLFFGAVLPALAQHARISGTVTDPHGALVTQAEVQVTNLDTAGKAATKTGKEGAYLVDFLPAGRYQVTVQAPGFRSVVSAGIDLTEGQALIHDVQLTIGLATTSITVKDRLGSISNPNPDVAVGPLPGKALQDLPYSITVIPSTLIENAQATMAGVLAMIPTAQLRLGVGYTSPPTVFLRGLAPGNVNSVDGLRTQIGTPTVEETEQLEVFTGLSGFLYGPAAAGGTLNWVRKRPTATRFENITIGDYGNAGAYAHGDFGGPIDKNGKFGYRVNIVGQNGSTPVQYQSQQRYYGGGSLDYHITGNLLLQVDGAHDYLNLDGTDAYWSFPTNSNGSAKFVHTAPVAADKLWGQKFDTNEYNTTEGGAKVRWDLSHNFTLRAAYLYRFNNRGANISVTNAVADTSGVYSYTETLTKQAPYKYQETASYGFLDAHFHTGSIQHKITGGYFDTFYTQWATSNQSTTASISTGFSFLEPHYVAKPAFKALGGVPYHSASKFWYRNGVIGDDITISRAWSALVGLTYSDITTRSYAVATGVGGIPYEKGKLTPSASVIYRPASWVSTYFTYIEDLEPGVIVPSSGSPKYTNPGPLPPYTNREYEAGVKAALGKALLTASFFDIDEALQYAVQVNSTTSTYVQSGRERHKGVEFSATGKAFQRLTLFGGATFFGAKVRDNQQNPLLDGKTPANVSEQMFKLYAEYAIPKARGLNVTGGVYYTGKFFADTLNTDKLPSFATEDLGVRYDAKLYKPLIFRGNVTNLTNKSYWLQSGYIGPARSVSFSTEIKF
jgi:iron complex outermembrane receptor protein